MFTVAMYLLDNAGINNTQNVSLAGLVILRTVGEMMSFGKLI